jgi:hypothetical protein
MERTAGEWNRTSRRGLVSFFVRSTGGLPLRPAERRMRGDRQRVSHHPRRIRQSRSTSPPPVPSFIRTAFHAANALVRFFPAEFP